VGTRGVIPKRDDQRIRRNKPEVPTDTVTAIGAVPIPDLNIPDPHPLVEDLYESLRNSAQNRYFEPSDWAYARLTMHTINDMLKGKGEEHRISPMMLAAVNTMLSNLLLTEGDRRRVRIEVERQPTGPIGTVTSISDVYRERLSQSVN
jgi:hypothetical protein